MFTYLLLCLSGYHRVGDCKDPTQKCEKCPNNTFTSIENYVRKCHKCGTCSNVEKQIQPCNSTSDVVCVCIEGYYNANSNVNSKELNCQSCNCKSCTKPPNHDFEKKCNPCQRCLSKSECMSRCNTTTDATTTVLATSAATRLPNSTPNMTPVLQYLAQMFWFSLGLAAAVLIFSWCLVYFIKHSRVNKDLELPSKLSAQDSHPSSLPTTVTFSSISEETPMMTVSQSPAAPQHPAHIAPQLPDHEDQVTKQDVQVENWPAIVLYAIIKEVPLRRWKEFLRLLSVADQQLERVELEAGLGPGSLERQYQMLRLWSQRSSANLADIYSALHYMDLSGCAQQLQEALDKLQWRAELK
ncbi:uncharacterized protein V6R79_009143 [Siganus canaliculatus]